MELTTSQLSILDRLPLVSQLDAIFNLKAYLNTPEGASRLEQWNAAFKAHHLAKRWVPIAGICIIIVALFTRMLLAHFMLLVLIEAGLYLTLRVLKGNLGKKQKNYLSGRWDYAAGLAKSIVTAIGGYYYLFDDGYMFFYNDRLCIYADAAGGGLTAYNKASVKKVNMEHVHLGSTTVSHSNTTGIGFNRGSFDSNAYGNHGWYRGISTNFSSTKTTANTQTHYEWKLDILTSFVEAPHITMVFPDDKDGEETVKRACALLS